MKKRFIAVLLLELLPLWGQTKIDYNTQLKNQPLIGLSDTMIGNQPGMYADLPALCAAAVAKGQSVTLNVPHNIASGFTCGAAITFNYPGSIIVASGQTVTIGSNFSAGPYQQIFGGPGSIAFSGTPPMLNPNWFGTHYSNPSITDDVLGFNAAAASGNTIQVPLGTYSFVSGGFALTAAYSHLSCDPGAILQYTGSGNIDSTVAMGVGSADTSFGQSFEGCTIYADTRYVTSALHLNHTERSLVSNVQLWGGKTQALFVDTSVVTQLDSVVISHGTSNWPSHLEPPLGIHVYSSNVITLISPTVEYMAQSQAALATTTGTASNGSTSLTIASGIGTANAQAVFCVGVAPGTTVASGGGTTSITLSQNTIGAVSGTCTFGFTGGTGTGIQVDGSEATTIIGGTSESNNVNVDVLNGSANTQIINMDDEGPYTYGIRDNGAQTSILGGFYVSSDPDTYSYPAIFLGPNSDQFHIQNSDFDTEAYVAPLYISSGAVNAHIGPSNRFGTALTGVGTIPSLIYTITDNGTCTVLEHSNSFINADLQMRGYDTCTPSTQSGGVSFGSGSVTQQRTSNSAGLISGTVNTSGTAVSWVSGSTFQTWWTGAIPINGTLYTISSCASTTSCTLTSSAGTQTGVAYGSANNAIFATLADAGTGLPITIQPGTDIFLNVYGFTLQANGSNSMILNGSLYSGAAVPIVSQYGTNLGAPTISGGYYHFIAYGVPGPGGIEYWLLEGAPPPISCTSTAVPSGGGTPTITCTQ